MPETNNPPPETGPAPPGVAETWRCEVLPGLSHIDPASWDRLLDADDAPLLSWAYLQGLEETGCVGEGTGWYPAHLVIRPAHEDGAADELLAAAPAYLKTDSDGEWVYDLDWAAYADKLGLSYYPKLVLAVPWNPVTGGRLLTPPGLPAGERRALRRALVLGAQALCDKAQISSVHLLFPRADELDGLDGPEAGFALRRQEQYHFLNEGYATFEDFLGRMNARRRHSIRRERRALREAGIEVRTHRGLRSSALPGAHPGGFSIEDLDTVFDLYVGTSVRYSGGPPYLNRAFVHLLAERIGDRLELVLARGPGGRVLGGALNLRGDRRLYGRYWGEAERVPFLHFEVCFYHSVERCIMEGLAAFEPGHGGEQKLLRGFQPVWTHSAHFLRDPRLHRPIQKYIELEAGYAEASLQAARKRCPLRQVRGLADRGP